MNDTHAQNGALDERAQRILEAAARLIIHYGFDKTTMSEIASEAGVSKSTLYGYWKSKEDLLDTLFWNDMMDYAEKWYARIEADPRGGTMIGIYTNILHVMQHYPLLMALFKQDQRVLGAYTRRQSDMMARRASINKELIHMMQKVGAVRDDIDADVVAHIMAMLSYGLVAMNDVMPEEEIPDIERIIDGIGIILDRALTPQDGGNSEAGKAVIRQILDAGKAQLNQIRENQTAQSAGAPTAETQDKGSTTHD